MSFSKISLIRIPKSVLTHTFDFLRKQGNRMLESHAIWVGTESGNVFDIAEAWFPEQYGTAVSYEVPEEEEFRINLELNKKHLTTMCQIHTHPSSAFHSSIDDEGSALVLVGSISVVIPDFGFIKEDDLYAWEVYRFTGSRWAHLSKKEVKRLFQII